MYPVLPVPVSQGPSTLMICMFDPSRGTSRRCPKACSPISATRGRWEGKKGREGEGESRNTVTRCANIDDF